MNEYFLPEKDFNGFIKKLIGSRTVIGPVAKKNKFIFDEVSSPEELRLDYDVTILPPKKAFFPQRQNLVEFVGNSAHSCIKPKDQILFGVHFYDIKAIDMLDLLFTENHTDNNYLANRNATTIVASSIQKISDRAFWASVGKDVKPKGHDAFLTKISGGYLFETITPKGEALVSSGGFTKPKGNQVDEAKRINDETLKKCPETLTLNSDKISKKVRSSFKDMKLWDKLSKDCFSCGTCNIVCPTCYCFDVQDVWNLDQTSGVRYRVWDGCQTEDFAKVSLGAGRSENFREERSQRYRHRFMRKATYLNDKLGGPACVGCGRCSVGCVPDIADPVKIINQIMEA